VTSYPITSPYGPRVHDGVREFHTGLDIGTPLGTELFARVPTKIVEAGSDADGYGNWLLAQLPNGSRIRLAHLQDTHQHRIGRTLPVGAMLARTGDTGNSTGPHLHFEVRLTPQMGSAVDPRRWLKERGVRLRA
jgi:murein DD-endopeptidase MepM/ murein hydrolase activator NlpD